MNPTPEFEAAVADIFNVAWYVVDDDLIGGSAITNVNKPLSALDYDAGDVLIVDLILSHTIATHIVNLHNAILTPIQPITIIDEGE